MFFELVDDIRAGFVAAAFLLATCIAIEHVGPIKRYTFRSRIPGALMFFVGGALGTALMWPVQLLWVKIGVAAFIVIPLWDWLQPLGKAGYALMFLAMILVMDFLAYWRHRAEHRWFWPIHAVHHSPTELHAANDIGHPAQTLIQFAFVTVPLSLIQIDGPGTPFAVGMIVSLLSMYIHSPIGAHFGRGRAVVVDNRFHRIHHSVERRHFDKNFGICLSCWDFLFGTAYQPGAEWPEVGVHGIPAPTGLRSFLLLPALVMKPSRLRQPQRDNSPSPQS